MASDQNAFSYKKSQVKSDNAFQNVFLQSSPPASTPDNLSQN